MEVGRLRRELLARDLLLAVPATIYLLLLALISVPKVFITSAKKTLYCSGPSGFMQLPVCVIAFV